MKLFLDPFPFRNPEARSSIGDVIAEIVNGGAGVISEGGVKAALHDFMEGLPAKAVAALRPIMGDSSIRGTTLRAKVGAALKRNGVPGMVLGGSSAQIVIDNWDTFHGELRESRMVGGQDLLQGVKNFVQGKGFKTNRDLSGARVNANMERLKAANAEDLKDKPGAAGKAAHKRLHNTIGKVLKSK